MPSWRLEEDGDILAWLTILAMHVSKPATIQGDQQSSCTHKLWVI